MDLGFFRRKKYQLRRLDPNFPRMIMTHFRRKWVWSKIVFVGRSKFFKPQERFNYTIRL